MATHSIEVKTVSGALGAEISGVDISNPLSTHELDILRSAFLEHQVICIRDQSLTPTQQIAFAENF